MNRNLELPLRKAIEAFRESQLSVYRSQPGRLQRDASSAKEVIRDHVGRWPYELVQNADDAGATVVEVRFTNDTVYFADNGRGLPASAVESLSGTYFSEKPPASIGRKGLGFKAVYCVSLAPAIFSGAEGLVFDRDKATSWMENADLSTRHVPYQWVPFWIGRNEEEKSDLSLQALKDFRTIVRLAVPTKQMLTSAWKLLETFNPQTLLTFAKLQGLKVSGPDNAVFEIGIDTGRNSRTVRVRDSRRQSPVSWTRVRARRDAPEVLLSAFEPGDDRERARHVDLLSAVPCDAKGHAKPLEDFPNLHVYYPTEELSPVRVLLHGDFLIKSDRTAIVSMAETPYNQWVGRELAKLLIQFVTQCYTQEAPAAYLRLLLSVEKMRPRSNTQQLWQFIVEQASASLLLPNSKGTLALKVAEGLRLSFHEQRKAARAILEVSRYAQSLVHPDFDENVEATQAMASLNVGALGPTDVLDCIREHAAAHRGNETWLWSCWEWLVEWTGNSKERLDLARSLTVIPCRDGLVSGVEAAETTVTWSGLESDETFPDWLPLKLVEDWFRDRLLKNSKNTAIRKLAEQLHIVEPDANTVLAALGRAAKSFWEQEVSEPERFLNLLIEKKWYETEERPNDLAFCPVPSRKEGSAEIVWASAQDAYFGREWGSRTLARLYEGARDAHWVMPIQRLAAKAELHTALEWLGVMACPWVIHSDDASDTFPERSRVGTYIRPYTWLGEIEPPTSLEHINPAKLSSGKCVLLLLLLAENWSNFYKNRAFLDVRYKYYGANTATVPSRWWEQVLSQSKPSLTGDGNAGSPLRKAWLSSERLRRLSHLLPCIALDSLSKKEREVLEPWLRDVVKLREHPEQMEDDEIESIVKVRIPALIPQSALSDRKKREQVSRWYGDLLRVCRERKKKAPDMSDCPRLCCKGEEWSYVADDVVWLDDDHDAALAFKGLVWRIALPRELRAIAQEVFGVRSLATHKRVVPQWSVLDDDDVKKEPVAQMSALLNDVKPFLFAWISHSQSDQALGKLRERIQSLTLRFVRDLQLSVSLDGIAESRTVSRAYAVDDHTLILDADRANEGSLAKALSEALGTAESEFFEILLRCPDEEARRRKLREDRDVAEDELERHLGEWHEGEPEVREAPVRGPVPNPSKGAGGDKSGKEEGPAVAAAPRPSSAGQAQRPSDQAASPHPEPVVTERTRSRKTLRLKDPKEANISVSNYEGRSGAGSATASSRHSWDQQVLTEQERKYIEQVSRKFAEAHLERLGYSVEQMPFENPGFDIRATKDGTAMLLVEVKGHLGRAAHIELTAREYREYSRCLQSKGESWELWNIEQLSEEKSGDVLLGRYQGIPDNALVGVRGFRVDLRACTKVEEIDRSS